jgi:hypothetical protein
VAGNEDSDAELAGRPRGVGIAALSVVLLAALCCPNITKGDPQATSSPPETVPIPPAQQIDPGQGQAPLERRVQAYVRAITRNPGLSNDDPPVRWNTPICLLVLGLSAENVKFVSDRLSQISTSAGAPLAQAPCQPNFIVVATSEPDRVLNAWSAKDKQLFGDATSAQIRQFLETSRSQAVRVWYNIDTGRKSGTHNGHFVPSNQRAESSVFVGSAAFNFFSIFAIIDTHRTEHIALDQLADYVCMTGLTDVNLEADLEADFASAPSVLHLFAPSGEGQPSGLSRWDAAFLKALYHSNQSSRTRRFEITERVIHDLSR